MASRCVLTVKKPSKRPTYLLMNAFGDNRKPGSLLLKGQDECRKIAKVLAQEMRDSLYNQRFKMAPLTAAYLAHKKQKKLDLRTLIAYKKYVKNIGFIPTPFGGIIGMINKFRIDRRGRKMVRLDYSKLQRWLEYGTRRRVGVRKSGKVKYGKVGSQMPARPHWRPMMRYWKAQRKKYGLQIKNVVGYELRKMIMTSARF